MKYNLTKGCHSVSSLQFHYVACIKYRKNILHDNIASELKIINSSVAKKFNVEIIEQETAGDHVHIYI